MTATECSLRLEERRLFAVIFDPKMRRHAGRLRQLASVQTADRSADTGPGRLHWVENKFGGEDEGNVFGRNHAEYPAQTECVAQPRRGE
jgi:hypothetical protein